MNVKETWKKIHSSFTCFSHFVYILYIKVIEVKRMYSFKLSNKHKLGFLCVQFTRCM